MRTLARFGGSLVPLSILAAALIWSFAGCRSTPASNSNASRPLPTDRGRVIVDTSLGYPRLLTDKGTPLRGVMLPWDGDRMAIKTEQVPSQDELDRLSKEDGLNALHLYLEKYDTNPDRSLNAGANAAACDLLVDRCSKAGLYLIITIGNGNAPNLNGYIPSMAFARSFWNFYAPRYKNRTHVIYEVHNEPGEEVSNIDAIMTATNPAAAPRPIPRYPKWAPSDWTRKVLDHDVELYKLIRAQAPASHVLMFSWSGIGSAMKARQAIDYATSQGVDWSKTSVAIHGYGVQGDQEALVDDLLYSSGNPAALTCTEVEDTFRTKLARQYERNGVGWLLFTGLEPGYMANVRADFDRAGVAWKPEIGSWPDTVGAPIGSIVRLKTSTGAYVAADPELESALSTSTTADAYTEFVVVNQKDQGAGMVALKSVGCQRYVSGEFSDGDTPAVTCMRTDPKEWETLGWIDLGGGRCSLQSPKNKKYLALSGRSFSLSGDSPQSTASSLSYEVVSPNPVH